MMDLNSIGSKNKGFLAKMPTRYKLSNKEPPFMCVFYKVNFKFFKYLKM